MKLKYILIVIVLLLGCQIGDLPNRKSFKLIDKEGMILGNVTCVLPIDFDTTYQWVHQSDCTCCDAFKYRAHSTNYVLISENGFLPDSYLDSGFYFTISHFTYLECDTSKAYYHSGSEATPEARNERFMQNIKELEDFGGSKVVFDTNLIINNLKYSSVYYVKKNYWKEMINDSIKLKTITFNTLDASTKYKGRRIQFTLQSNVHAKDTFYNLAMDILRTIKIKE